MAKYFLGSVGTAEAFRKENDGSMKIAFVSKTLTSSAINVTIIKDELRAGTNAPVVCNFYHDPTVAITLTDILYKSDYVAAQLGTTFAQSANVYFSESRTADDNVVTLSSTPAALPLACDNGKVIVWYTEEGKEEWHALTMDTASKSVTIPNGGSKKFCLRYLTANSSADVQAALIKSDIVPSELFLLITVPLFSGDACSASRGKIAGNITFEVPRFQLDGGQEFTFDMSSNATMNLSGTAMAVDSGCDINSKELFRMIEYIEGRDVTTGMVGVMIDPSTAVAGAALADVDVYGVYENGSANLIDHSNLTFVPTTTPIVAGSLKVTVTGTTFKDTITIA